MKQNMDQVLKLIDQIRQIPDQYRNFTINEKEAYSRYGVHRDLFKFILQHNFPSKDHETGLYMDAYDLSNLSLHLKLSSIQRMAMRSWGSLLKKSIDTDKITVDLSYVVEPEFLNGILDNIEQPLEFTLLTPEGKISTTGMCGVTLKEYRLNMKSKWPAFTPEQKLILDEITEFEFFMLPEQVRWNLDFINSTHLSECGGASKYAWHRAKELGIEARQCFGLLIATPYSTGHFWTEFMIDEQWVPADPLLLKVLSYSCGLSQEQWPFNRSPGVAFLRLADIVRYEAESGRPIIEHYEKQIDLVNPIATINNLVSNVTLATVVTA